MTFHFGCHGNWVTIATRYVADDDFLPGIFQGGKIYCYANFFCCANYSIVLKPIVRGDKSL